MKTSIRRTTVASSPTAVLAIHRTTNITILAPLPSPGLAVQLFELTPATHLVENKSAVRRNVT